MGEHISHQGDTLQHMDVVGYHMEALYAASKQKILELHKVSYKAWIEEEKRC